MSLDRSDQGFVAIFNGKNGESMANKQVEIERRPSKFYNYVNEFDFSDRYNVLNDDEEEDIQPVLTTDSKGKIDLGHLDNVSSVELRLRDGGFETQMELSNESF